MRANASPKLATSTPASLSLVAVSAPGKVAAPPSRRSTTTSAIAYPGATSPMHAPWMHATSPAAEIAGSALAHASSTTTPPRGPASRPAARASSSRGVTPVATTTTSTSSRPPSANSSRPTAPWRFARMRVVAVSTRTATPSWLMSRRSASPPPRSTCADIRCVPNWMTVLRAPSACSAPAASSPSRPPPMTAPRTGRPHRCACSSTQPRRAATSSSVRYTNTPGRSLPGMGGMAAREPVARTRWS